MTAATRRRLTPAAFADRWLGGLPRLFWVLWTGILINRLGTLVEPLLGVYLVAARGFPVAAAGAVLAVYALGSMASQIAGGWLADRLGRRATLTAGMLANGSSLIALGYVTAAPAVITMTFAAGATIDMYRPAAQALVADLIPAAGRARAFGLISWAANLGFSAAMLTGGMLAQAGFHWLFWADALTCAAFAVLAWRAMPRTPARPAAQAKQASGSGDVLRDRVMAGFLLVVLGQMAVYQQGFTTLPIAMHAASLPPRDYGLVMALNGVMIVAVQPLAGNWLGQRDHSLVIMAGNGYSAPGSRRPAWPRPSRPTAAPCASGRSARSPSPRLAAPSSPIWPPRKDVHRLPRIPKGRGISAMSQERHEPFIRPQPRCRRRHTTRSPPSSSAAPGAPAAGHLADERTAVGATLAGQGLRAADSIATGVADAYLVIEVVPERMDLKRAIFAELD